MSPKFTTRRDFLKSTVLAAVAAPLLQVEPLPRAGVSSFALDEVTIGEMRNGLENGKFTARKLAELYFERIKKIDQSGPRLNSVIELNPDTLAIADQLDAERRAKKVRGPLHGIPILIKDNIATADKMQTTAGSLALMGSKSPKDSFVAARLRAAGAVILGKTNLSEWANFRGEHSTSGWSGRGGQTHNPYALDRNPSGSSSGSAVAAAASLCAVAIGTETDGSIVSPCSLNGLVGIKPTVGLVSRAGIVPISHTQDTAGPIARTVADAAALLTALAGIDENDEATAASRGHSEAHYTKFLNPSGLKGARLGVVRKLAGFNRHVDRVFEEALAALKHAGAEIIDPVEITAIGKVDAPELQVLQFEFKADLNKYLAWLGPNTQVHTLKEVIEFNERNAAREMPYFGQELMQKSEAKGELSSADYQKALADCRRLSRAEGIDRTMEKHKLDALVAPTDSPAWLTDFIDGDHFSGSSSTLPAVAGYPHITVPMGEVFGLPVGISLFGRAWSEVTLIKLAHAFEQMTKARKPPRFLASVQIGSAQLERRS